MPGKRRQSRDHKPFTVPELMRRENIPASKDLPAAFVATRERERLVLSSREREFDPRRSFTRLEGPGALWEARLDEGAIFGRRVQKVVGLKPGSRKRGAPDVVQGFRPLWHPDVYHPKLAVAGIDRPRLSRKSGAKVTPEIIYNHDDRVLIIPQGYPWQCVGRILIQFPNSTKYRISTGTLVGKRTVLTCAHAIPWDQPGAFSMEFVPAYYAGYSALGSGVKSWVTEVRGYPDAGAGWDLAIAHLDQPLGEWLGTFGATVYDSSWEDMAVWSLMGYPNEFQVVGVASSKLYGELPTIQHGIAILDDDSDGDALELEHEADTSEGNSGGPLWGLFPKGRYIVGVHGGFEGLQIGGYTMSSNNIAAGGTAMVDLAAWGRSNWG